MTKLRRTESAGEWTPKYIDAVSVTFVSTLLISNIAAVKLFGLGPATFTAGVLVFPITYIFGDVLTEVYGFVRARRVIYMGLLANIFMALILWLSVKLPPADGWTLQDAYAAVHNQAPRIVLASVLSYVAGELTNSYVMSSLKVVFDARRLWIRTIGSTIAGQFVDNALFVTIAFGGVYSTRLLMLAVLSGWLFKVFYEAAATPLTYFIVGKMKALEGVEHFDVNDKRRIIG
ncbi:MAG: queuosine precursor transporter [Kiritimatiellae bacterium]|jgi:uncharacterized integral membrane protein (TIGR00697 family)|nr:queuosine precursor transporter [Kiritimatiellia bacterium]